MAFYTSRDFSDAPLAGSVRKAVYENETLFLTIEFEPGFVATPHNHTWATLYYITGGQGRVLIGDEWREVGPGTLAMVPAHAMHGIEAVSRLTLIEVQCNCPQSFADWVMGRAATPTPTR